MVELTDTQKKAVQTAKGNVCVSAGAGTGKTRVLVERFLYLVEQKLARSHEILAITFTEKAAQEMKKRITNRFREQGLEGERRELESAYIGTIHSFCARILREHPIEAGIDPEFRVIEEHESNLFRETVLDALMEARFQEPAVFDLLRVYSEEGIREALKQAVSRVHTFGKSISEIACGAALLRGALATPGAMPRNDVPKGTVQNATVIASEAKQSKIKVLEALKPLKQLKGKEEDCADVDEALQKPISNWDELEALKKIGKRFEKRGKAKAEIEAFRNLLDDFISLNAELLGQITRNAFLSLASDFETRYQALKRERSTLDFNDLEREAVRLLGGREPKCVACRSFYRDHFKYIMVRKKTGQPAYFFGRPGQNES